MIKLSSSIEHFLNGNFFHYMASAFCLIDQNYERLRYRNSPVFLPHQSGLVSPSSICQSHHRAIIPRKKMKTSDGKKSSGLIKMVLFHPQCRLFKYTPIPITHWVYKHMSIIFFRPNLSLKPPKTMPPNITPQK